MSVISNEKLSEQHNLLTLTPTISKSLGSSDSKTDDDDQLTLKTKVLPEIKPGQFVQVAVPGAKDVFLRRPISINFVDNDRLQLLVMNAGRGTNVLCHAKEDDVLNIVLPLGNGFDTADCANKRYVLIGGGVGVAPLLYLGKVLVDGGADVTFLLGARTADLLLEKNRFTAIATTYISTEDGSEGDRGFVTQNHILSEKFDQWICCGPTPMMKAVAALARERQARCSVSLENMMACGVGACLCCVEKTVRGNRCVCTEGPVFDINELTW